MRNLNGLAWRNLMQRKLRTSLSVVGVTLGVALVFAAASVGLAAGNNNAEPTDHVDFQITSSSGTFIDQALVEKARAAKGVQAVAPTLTLSAIGANDIGITLSLNGIEPAADGQVHTRQVAQGSFLTGDG